MVCNGKRRQLDTGVYISVLKELVEEGKEVCLILSGGSMLPFLAPQRDQISFRKPERTLKKGDMVFFQRDNGRFVMHRIRKIRPEGYYLIGDAQIDLEGPVREDQIFALVTSVQRKGKWIGPGDFWWEFFEHVWLYLVPFRQTILKIYAKWKWK